MVPRILAAGSDTCTQEAVAAEDSSRADSSEARSKDNMEKTGLHHPDNVSRIPDSRQSRPTKLTVDGISAQPSVCGRGQAPKP